MNRAHFIFTISAILLYTFTATAQIDEALRTRAMKSVTSTLDNIIEHGKDRYGDVHSDIIMSVIDTRTNESPREPEVLDAFIRTEGRLHRRNPAGADLWDDQPLIHALYAATHATGEKKYADAADAYIRDYFKHAKKPNGLLAWGSHIYYDAFRDAPGGDQDGAGPHETLVHIPDWPNMYRVAPDAVRNQIDLVWEWHMVDRDTGEFNRHDDKNRGCDFAFMGGELVYAFAFMYKATGEEKYLDWAKTVANRHWSNRNRDTDLMPDAPSTGDRYDAHHSFTSVSGPYAMLLLKAEEVAPDNGFADIARSAIQQYDRYGWDAEANRYWGMLQLDGTPVKKQPRGLAYDRWKPTGHADTWRPTLYSYEFPPYAAQAAAYATLHHNADSTAAKHWAKHIHADLPVNIGNRWREELVAIFPGLANSGAYAENYARAIDYFITMAQIENKAENLNTAAAIADDALDHLYANGWITGLPGKPYYESIDGVALLMNSLLELSEVK